MRVNTILYIASLILLIGCNTNRATTDSSTIYVTIAPIEEIIEGITGDDFPIETLVPTGASPETFEPTPRQIIALNKSQFVFSVGLIDFESSLTSRIATPDRIINLSKNIDIIAGSCSHHHDHDHAHSHSHGIDPHIWTSPRQLITMSDNAYEAIHDRYPDSTKYTLRYTALREKLQQLDEECALACEQSQLPHFIIFHPALTYFARDYGIKQIAIEDEGKEPSARRLADIIELARQSGVTRILYQSQFPQSVVEIIASDIGAEATAINPLSRNNIENIRRTTQLITKP